MRVGRRVALLLTMLAACAAGVHMQAQAQAQPQTPGVFRSTTELVVLQVSVLNGQHRFVSGLAREDFSVFARAWKQGEPVTGGVSSSRVVAFRFGHR